MMFTRAHLFDSAVTYLQSSPGGATVFGWTIDRTLINTIFFIQLSLDLFVLGKTVSFCALFFSPSDDVPNTCVVGKRSLRLKRNQFRYINVVS